jgi:flavin reductase
MSAISQKTYRDAMARLGAAVHIVTTDGPGGRAGFTASAVCSVTDDPPTLLVCMNRGSSVHAAFRANGVLCVNTLSHAQQGLSVLFGGKTPVAQRFEAAGWIVMASGAPVLQNAVASFDCRVQRMVDGGTHDVLFCEVMSAAIGQDQEALIYFDRGYHRVAARIDGLA